MESRLLKWCFPWLLLLLFLFSSIKLPYDATELRNKKSELPNITIVATGGTIAGATSSSDGTTNYEAGVLSINTITQGIGKELRSRANVDVEQFMNVDSININSSLAISLSQHITKLAADPSIHGVVLAHGTDLMPEIAAFLGLTVISDKPIAMTGAIKPHTAISADGPGNIVAAVNTAATTGWISKGHEVVIIIQDKIMAPWGTKKENNLFLPGPRSLLGDIVDFKPFFRWLPGPCAPMKFDISQLSPETPLPEVAILQAHQDFRSGLVAAAIDMGAKGIVLVGYGDGYWPVASAEEIKKLAEENKVVIVFAAEGQLEYVANARIGVGIPGGDWNPRQLRIFLQILLWAGAGEEDIRSAILSLPESCPTHETGQKKPGRAHGA